MSVRWERFSGDTSRFAIKIAFLADPDDGQGVDPDVATSWGALTLWVDGINLCGHVDQGESLQASHWYLLPLLEWLVAAWDPLLHEERLPSASARYETAADLAGAMPSLSMASVDLAQASNLDQQRFDWEQRHSFRTARDGGLLPDVRFRRLRDQLEISWSNSPLAGAQDVEFITPYGRSYQEPTDVATALYEVLRQAADWLRQERPESTRIAALYSAVDKLKDLDRSTERTAWLAALGDSRDQMLERWLNLVESVEQFASPEAFDEVFGPADAGELVLSGSCEAALLFGSASPTIDQVDALNLARLMLGQYTADHEDVLSDLVSDEPFDSGLPTWEHGYELAEVLLDKASNELIFDTVDVERFLAQRGVAVLEVDLSDSHVRAVSFVGPHHPPTVALNTSSRFFRPPTARRFTLAHELCHLLFDRSRGSRLAVASGPWAPRVVEQRANAFAAMLLMPPDLVMTAVAEAPQSIDSADGLRFVASKMGVAPAALLEHAYNLGLIDELDREELRSAFNVLR